MDLCEKLAYGKLSGPKLMENNYTKLSAEELEIHARLDKMIDVSKPLLPQVKKMTNVEFMAFVKRPRHINDDDGIILFEEGDEATKRDMNTNLKVITPAIFIMLAVSFMYSNGI